MSQTVYFIGNQHARDVYDEFQKRGKKRKKDLIEFCEPYGELTKYWGNPNIVGVLFKKEPDKSLWRETKRRGWVPKRSSKAGKELAKVFWEFGKDLYPDLGKEFGYKDFCFTGEFFSRNPSLILRDDKIIVGYPDYVLSHENFKMPEGYTELKYSEYLALKEKKK